VIAMPLTDKEIALQFLEHIENYLVQTSLLQNILTHHVPNWQQEYNALLRRGEAGARGLARLQLQPMRNLVLEAPDLSSVVEQLLKDIPRNDPK
jgi:hypothetical protein